MHYLVGRSFDRLARNLEHNGDEHVLGFYCAGLRKPTDGKKREKSYAKQAASECEFDNHKRKEPIRRAVSVRAQTIA
jgi:hypothetical protein